MFRTILCNNDQPHSPVFCAFIHSAKSTSSVIPSSYVTSSSSSSSMNFHATIPTSIGVIDDKTDSESNLSHSKSDIAQEEHFYDVLDAISDYKITNNNTSNAQNVVNETAVYTPPIENVPFTNDIAYINPCGPIGRNFVVSYLDLQTLLQVLNLVKYFYLKKHFCSTNWVIILLSLVSS